MSSAVVPTRSQLLKLYRSYLSTAQSFSSYNFRTYFLRRSRDLFRSTLLPPAQAASSSLYSKAGAATTPKSPPTLLSPSPSSLSSSAQPGASTSSAPESGAAPPQGVGSDSERLAAFYATALKDLDVMRRAALTNRMYQGEKLVVERPKLIVGGGGAGAEGSTGGSGQPVAGPQSGGGAPRSD